ncbi:unnamed protein product [Vitrella brassicaformis CCMP3155]|uniref:DUF155 domain-containing protein n=2 Tax=Vitrella brassicaformis TaxID=1169539 RepID=A0A0G4H1N7_VITBC|nr:unnamed protein product [Vitrella brassicaformis CCMP3155]|mmetsp:Transcript_20903/g.59624  ORF Transcript_20903/g.59624 Transcript_20903/m.59624 type:complete len:401 (-) Transcript_20903:443-1645(-)|eukprot:CEM37414.1 unnamed protein product [Vitrella brassicaformis CCMP3155]
MWRGPHLINSLHPTRIFARRGFSALRLAKGKGGKIEITPAAVVSASAAARKGKVGVTVRPSPGTPLYVMKARPEATIVELKPHVDANLMPPDPHVRAHSLACTIDLRRVAASIREQRRRDSDNAFWGDFVFRELEHFLMAETGPGFSQQACTAVFFKSGCVVFWGMTEDNEYRCVATTAAPFMRMPVAATLDELWAARETETMDVTDTEGDSHIENDVIYLRTHDRTRPSDKLSMSFAMMTAARLSALENKIERVLAFEKRSADRMKKLIRPWRVSALGEGVFDSLINLHNLRYELNIEQGLTDVPDVMWDYEGQTRLFEKLQRHHDIKQRLDLLNARLDWTFHFLGTFSEHLQRLHSANLEKIIIGLIALELLIGISDFVGFHPALLKTYILDKLTGHR